MAVRVPFGPLMVVTSAMSTPSRLRSVPLAAFALVVGAGVVAAPAEADHTDPREPLAPVEGSIASGISRGAGTWQHLANFPGLANPALTGGGTDLEFFKTGKSKAENVTVL